MNNIIAKIKDFFKSNSEIFIPTVVMLSICVVVTLALSSTNMLTAGKIAEISEENNKKAMTRLIEADEYHELQAQTSFGDVTYNAAIKNGDTVGCIFTVNTNGYGGEVSVMTAVNMDGSVAAVEILDASNETPGLGQNVTKADWISQFKGLSNNISVIKGGTANPDNNEINAVTGATISSKAVTAAVNQALDYASEIIVSVDSAVLTEVSY